ncbi:hypothetical protein A6J40_12025 [Legionella longbeachae]|uniref:hypothetical protein n=1 Tax=Legionella longbeachae TaxID=450 RepID=UPI0009B7B494|nr:hypothetical protein [Legionella longbeachae]ARB92859.1 hypothetical protein A6J40_12025 [Legionella longbeachae]RZV26508.1 hypothetical protein EKG34_05045 [Legionella longbeachae]UAK47253.1 hypothetical protein K8O86_03415 [Legionella longbeachae]VEE04318.1 Uncharacterised protein [Legionella oakridgensis]
MSNFKNMTEQKLPFHHKYETGDYISIGLFFGLIMLIAFVEIIIIRLEKYGYYKLLKQYSLYILIGSITFLTIYVYAFEYEYFRALMGMAFSIAIVVLIDVEGKEGGVYAKIRKKIISASIFLSIWSLVALGVYIFAQYYSWNSVFIGCAVTLMMYCFASYIANKVAAKVYEDFQYKIKNIDRNVDRLREDLQECRHHSCSEYNYCCKERLNGIEDKLDTIKYSLNSPEDPFARID